MDQPKMPENILKLAEAARSNTIPEKSKGLYFKEYEKFITWKQNNNIPEINETSLLAYFKFVSTIKKPSSLWTVYSMLKSTMKNKHYINIEKYLELYSFLKNSTTAYHPKKSATLSEEDINKFLKEAPDAEYLAIKVMLIFGLCGACRREELYKMKLCDVEDKNNGVLLVRIPETKTYKPRTFVVTGDEFYNTFKKYITLRPRTVSSNSNLFLNYQKGKCTKQVIGINKIGGTPKEIATFLKLENPEKYTGHSFRRTSATVLSNAGADITTLKKHGGWKSTTVAEGYIDESVSNKTKICKDLTKNILKSDEQIALPNVNLVQVNQKNNQEVVNIKVQDSNGKDSALSFNISNNTNCQISFHINSNN